ncbi:winged helix DNA-binding protein [Actinomadura sp. ATCC 31491]|uniref:Winged helix DNA-binding protein n=1 Tax=Actinomadura luzonensis TaxID=2805427 RepID=A0ABT0G7L3_9ACTN|nr:winged helix DNA-binding protein [Actinomadura luzonensis]MCK2220579.1 winged helix DNA-binding protein [Actinomadura luzonensis]
MAEERQATTPSRRPGTTPHEADAAASRTADDAASHEADAAASRTADDAASYAADDARYVADAADDVRADIGSWPVGRLLSVAARLVERRFHDFLAAHHLSHAGLIALHHLTSGPLPQRELATACRVTDQTMSRTIEHLRRTGYIAKRSDARDRRRMLVELTDAGTAVLALAREKERDSGDLLGAVEDYDRFREDLIRLITIA